MSEITIILDVEIYRGERGDPGQETISLPLTATLGDLMVAAQACRAERVTILPRSTRWPSGTASTEWPQEKP